MNLIQNAIYIPEVDLYLNSLNRHDFQLYRFKDGREIFIDGGKDYLRRGLSGGAIEYEDYTIRAEDPLPVYVERLLWGTRGKDGKSPLKFRPLRLLVKEHLSNILKNCPDAGMSHVKVIKYILSNEPTKKKEERDNGIVI